MKVCKPLDLLDVDVHPGSFAVGSEMFRSHCVIQGIACKWDYQQLFVVLIMAACMWEALDPSRILVRKWTV